MRRLAPLLLSIFLAACNAAPAPSPAAAAPSPATAPTPSVCPSLAIVNAFVAATVRFDGAAAAALFVPDGFIEVPGGVRLGARVDVNRFVGTNEIQRLVSNTVNNQPPTLREIQITRSPQGCESMVTFGLRTLPISAGAATDLNGTATLRDGKIVSVVYVAASP